MLALDCFWALLLMGFRPGRTREDYAGCHQPMCFLIHYFQSAAASRSQNRGIHIPRGSSILRKFDPDVLACPTFGFFWLPFAMPLFCCFYCSPTGALKIMDRLSKISAFLVSFCSQKRVYPIPIETLSPKTHSFWVCSSSFQFSALSTSNYLRPMAG